MGSGGVRGHSATLFGYSQHSKFLALPIGEVKDTFPRMEHRSLGGLKVPVLSFGTGTFGGSNEFFKAWGGSGLEEATRMVDVCLDAGLNFFDTADIYSQGLAEEILG